MDISNLELIQFSIEDVLSSKDYINTSNTDELTLGIEKTSQLTDLSIDSTIEDDMNLPVDLSPIEVQSILQDRHVDSEIWEGSIVKVEEMSIIAEVFLLPTKNISKLIKVNKNRVLEYSNDIKEGYGFEYIVEFSNNCKNENAFRKINMKTFPPHRYTQKSLEEMVERKMARFKQIYNPNERPDNKPSEN